MGDTLVFQGKAWVFGDNLDADWQICSLETLAELRAGGVPLTAEELGKVCLQPVDPEFGRKVNLGDFIVAGANAGASVACLDGDPEDPHLIGAASLALKGAGIAAVLCESSNMTFLRNSVHHGLPVVECRALRGRVRQGDELRVDLARGAIQNLTTGESFRFSPYPDFLLDMIRVAGLYPQLKNASGSSGT
ncbi:MAG: 3-isopropylmalate dehydratase [Chloroflexi bacterium]|nr:3-isopropylmalate dehydratase [Chloroflexota bacterium]